MYMYIIQITYSHKVHGTDIIKYTVVLNSEDLHEKPWHPTFTYLDNMPHNILCPIKHTEMHW